MLGGVKPPKRAMSTAPLISVSPGTRPALSARPSLNQVAVRQGFLDAVLATGWNEKGASPADAELLARVDQAIVTRR